MVSRVRKTSTATSASLANNATLVVNHPKISTAGRLVAAKSGTTVLTLRTAGVTANSEKMTVTNTSATQTTFTNVSGGTLTNVVAVVGFTVS